MEQENNNCVNSFIDKYAKRAFRRDLTDVERDQLRTLSANGKDFDQKIKLATQGMLTSAFTIYESVVDKGQDEAQLSGVELASRLSFLLWNSIPDDELLQNASQITNNQQALRTQIDRMLEDPRARNGMHNFVKQWLHLTINSGAISATETAENALLSSARFFDYLVRGSDGTLDQLFTDTTAIITPDIAEILGVTIPGNATQYDGAAIVTLDGSQRAGILTRPGFISSYSSPGRTSPTLTGSAIRDRVFCQEIPVPDSVQDAVDFMAADGLSGREFVNAHNAENQCADCHLYLDEIGITFDGYSWDGEFRTTYIGEVREDPDPETGEYPRLEDGSFITKLVQKVAEPEGYFYPLDAENSALKGRIDDAVILSQMAADSPVVAKCFAESWMRFALGRELKYDAPSVEGVMQRFSASGYNLKELIYAVIESDSFMKQGLNPEAAN